MLLWLRQGLFLIKLLDNGISCECSSDELAFDSFSNQALLVVPLRIAVLAKFKLLNDGQHGEFSHQICRKIALLQCSSSLLKSHKTRLIVLLVSFYCHSEAGWGEKNRINCHQWHLQVRLGYSSTFIFVFTIICWVVRWDWKSQDFA